ncbi:MAG: hypothetical protein QOI65_2202, partial [Thermoleophilaceae bacterium]|nr:hypothetical protein [Thermoleophilaceae bacterium]
KSKVNAKATAATKNPGRAPRRRSRKLTLRF